MHCIGQTSRRGLYQLISDSVPRLQKKGHVVHGTYGLQTFARDRTCHLLTGLEVPNWEGPYCIVIIPFAVYITRTESV